VLLSDPSFVQFATNEVVPSWEMVRPVPKVSIDFGNGRTLTRTLRGNTIMYLCTPDGRVVDAWPGVYTPAAFLPEAREAASIAKRGDIALDAWHSSLARHAYRNARSFTMSKSAVESPILDALDLQPVPEAAPQTAQAQVVVRSAKQTGGNDEKAAFRKAFEMSAARIRDVSEVPMRSPAARAIATEGAPASLSPTEAGKIAVTRDSVRNRTVIRPLVHT